jgi:hypothetical protein
MHMEPLQPLLLVVDDKSKAKVVKRHYHISDHKVIIGEGGGRRI